jgi:hypothetical protein
VDTIRISWPNGLIQNEMDQAVKRTAELKEAPRLSGSCPMVFAWDGRKFEFIDDVLGVAPLGASSGDGDYFPVSSHEYISIPGQQLGLREGRYEIRITEELHEVSYIDQVRLIALDHPAGVDIVTNEKFKSPPFPEFRLFGVTRRIFPVSARDGNGRDLLDSVLRRDRVYADGFRHDMAGVAEIHSLTLDFGPGAARDNRAVLMLSGWIDWADGSTFMAASQGSKDGLVLPYLQVKDAAGQWRTAIEDMGVPAGEPRTIAVDLTGKFLSASREVRIVTNTCVYWDQIYLSEDTAAPPARLTAMDAETADLTLRGFSRAVVDPRHEQPEYYDYSEWRPAAMWNPVPGLYTRFGDVRELVAAADDRLEAGFPGAGGRLVERCRRQHRLRRFGRAAAFPRDEPLSVPGLGAFPRRRGAPRLAQGVQRAALGELHRAAGGGAVATGSTEERDGGRRLPGTGGGRR